MSEGLFDETSAAGIAQEAEAQTLAALRRVLATAKAVADAQATVANLRGEIAAIAAGLGVDHRWTGTTLQLLAPDGAYAAGVDLQGDEGQAGPVSTIVVGSVTDGSQPSVEFYRDPNDATRVIADFVFRRGAAGIDGTNGWAPTLAAVADGARRVLQVADWTGGTGTKPSTGQYVGPAGLVSAIADATDVRGAPGTGTGDFTGPSASSDGELVLFSGAGGKTAKRSNTVPSAFGLARLADADAAAQRTALALAAVAASGAYGDLSGRPTLGSAAAKDAGAAAGNVPVLDGGGKLLASLLPALAISDISEVASQAAMLALTAERGDIAIRTDLNKTFALAAEPASTLANWKELRTPTDTVLSIAGLTGTITAVALKAALAIAAGDVSGLPAALALLAPLASPSLTGTPSAPSPPLGDTSTRLATSASQADALAVRDFYGPFYGSRA